MFTTIKKKLIALVFLIFGGGFAMAQVAPVVQDGAQERMVLTDIENIQFESRNKSQKYQRIPNTVDHDIFYQVDEYVTPSGGTGYKIRLRRLNRDGHIEEKYIVRGAEANTSHQYDWTVVREKPTSREFSLQDLHKSDL